MSETEKEFVVDVTMARTNANLLNLNNQRLSIVDDTIRIAGESKVHSFKISSFVSRKIKIPEYTGGVTIAALHFDRTKPDNGVLVSLKLVAKPNNHGMLTNFVDTYNKLIEANKDVISENDEKLPNPLHEAARQETEKEFVVDVTMARTNANLVNLNNRRVSIVDDTIRIAGENQDHSFKVSSFVPRKIKIPEYTGGVTIAALHFDRTKPDNGVLVSLKLVAKPNNHGMLTNFVDTYNKLIEANKDECLQERVSVNSLDKSGATPLYWAAHGGHVTAVDALLRDSKTAVSMQNKLGDRRGVPCQQIHEGEPSKRRRI